MLNLCDGSKLKNLTQKAKNKTTVYNENIWLDRCTCLLIDKFEVIEGTNFAITKKCLHYGKVGVLNFANPDYLGGGIGNGTMAQEERLCRSNNRENYVNSICNSNYRKLFK